MLSARTWFSLLHRDWRTLRLSNRTLEIAGQNRKGAGQKILREMLCTGFLSFSLTGSYVIGDGKTCRVSGYGARKMNWIDANLMDTNLIAMNSIETRSMETKSNNMDATVPALTETKRKSDVIATDTTESDITLGDVYERIADRLAEARTRALMGERQEALGLFQAASLDYTRFREVLSDYPGSHALDYAFTITMNQLCAEQQRAEPAEVTEQATIRPRTRRKAERAA
jgi:hypothetical protein